MVDGDCTDAEDFAARRSFPPTDTVVDDLSLAGYQRLDERTPASMLSPIQTPRTTRISTPTRVLPGSGSGPRVEIFSPRPKTPATPPSFPFLSTPSPELKRSKTTVSPPTPPRRPRARTRQTVSVDHAHGNVFAVGRRTSFESALAAFPAPPVRGASLGLFSRPAPPLRLDEASIPLLTDGLSAKRQGKGEARVAPGQDGGSEEMMLEWTDDDSDGRTVTGIPATPSTASSGWDAFWSEVSRYSPVSVKACWLITTACFAC